MSESASKPCCSCGKDLELEAAFCSVCGTPQTDDAPAKDERAGPRSFELAEEPEPPAPPPPEPDPEPDPEPEPEPEPEPPEPEAPPPIELADEPEPDGALDEADAGGDTVRMKFSDVVQAWAEDGAEPAAASPSTPEAVLWFGLPRKPLLLLGAAVLLIVLVVALL